MQKFHANPIPRGGPSASITNPTQLLDLRFKTLVGSSKWNELPSAVQQRFSKRLSTGEIIVYRGNVSETQLKPAGRILAAILGLVGSPLPKRDGARGAALVSVCEDQQLGGQIWTRIYAQDGRHPQVIHSTKRFAGPTGLEEHIGYGLAMSLDVTVKHGALVFRSRRYFITPARKLRIPIPHWLSHGQLEVVHAQIDDESFTFQLTLTHPWFGLLVSQTAHFVEAT